MSVYSFLMYLSGQVRDYFPLKLKTIRSYNISITAKHGITTRGSRKSAIPDVADNGCLHHAKC
jgi:hypothetical protein